MKRFIIGFSRPRGFFKPYSWAIRAIERTPYSHVYLKTRSESLGLDLIYQASGVQVNFMGLSNFLTHAEPLFEFEVEADDEAYKAFMKWAVTNAGAPYSAKQVLGILLIKLFNLKKNPLSNKRSAWVCSELVGHVLGTFTKTEMGAADIESAGPKAIYEICLKNLKIIEVQNGV